MEYLLKIFCYLFSFLSICFLGSIFLMRNDECPECLKTNKPTHLAAIAGIITLTYLNYYIYTLTFAISITVYLITFKIFGGKK